MIETIEFILDVTGLAKTVENYQKVHKLLLKEDLSTIIQDYRLAA